MKLQQLVGLAVVTIATLQAPAFAEDDVNAKELAAQLEKTAVVVTVVDPGADKISQGSGWEEESGWTNDAHPHLPARIHQSRIQQAAVKQKNGSSIVLVNSVKTSEI